MAVNLILNNNEDAVFELYQPDPSKQILPYDRAGSESVRALFKLFPVNFNLNHELNAEFMSTNGKLPLVNHGKIVLCGFEEVASYLMPGLDAKIRAYIDWVNSSFLHAEMAACWSDSLNLKMFTYPRYTYGLPWPLNRFYFWERKSEMRAKLGDGNFSQKFHAFLHELDQIIGDSNFTLGGDKATPVDYLIYGHVSTVLDNEMPSPLLLDMNDYANIMRISKSVGRLLEDTNKSL